MTIPRVYSKVATMKVPIKLFQRNMYKFLNQLPIHLTRHGRMFAMIVSEGIKENSNIPEETKKTEKGRWQYSKIMGREIWVE